MNDPRKHHYVPVFYQKHLTNSKGLLWVYDRKLKTYKELHPDVVCCEKDLYAIKPEGQQRDQRLESIALAQADGTCAGAIREIAAGVGRLPARATIEIIAQFVGLQYSRIPAMREFVSAMWESNTKESMRLIAVNEGRMQSVIDRYIKETGEPFGASAQTMVEAIRGNRLKLVVTEIPFLQHVIKAAEMVSHTVMQTSWQVLIASSDTSFVLSDHPVVVVPPRGILRVGFFVPGTVTYVPLTRCLCLRFSGHERTFTHRPVDRQTVRIINQNIAANSDRFIMGTVREQLERIVMRNSVAERDSEPRFTSETVQQDDDGSFLMISQNPRKYFYLKTATIAP